MNSSSSQLPSQPPEPSGGSGTSTSLKVVSGVLIVIGLALAAFGVYRLAAGDSVVDELENDVAALESQLFEVEDEVFSAQIREDELVTAALDLDTALINLEAATEAFVDAQQAAVLIYNGSIAPLEPSQRPPVIEAQFVPAITATEDALSELLTAQTEALEALSTAQAVAGTEE